jgi:capsular exopolysaccharide synthesis family protein
MELRDLIRILRKGLLFIVVGAVLGGVGGAAYALTQPKEYRSHAQLFVSVQASSTSALEIVQGGSAAQQKVKSYLDVVISSKVLTPVIDELHLATTPAALAGQMTVSSPLNSVIIDLYVDDTTPQKSAEIANAVAKSFADVAANGLESPKPGTPSGVRIETIEPAVAPLVPSNPAMATVALQGLLIGLVVGFGCAFLRSALDLRIHGTADVEGVTDKPILGTIGFDVNVSKRPLIVQSSPRSARAESFRALRTNLQFLGVDRDARSFVMTSAMPSEGKSTTCANLAIALAETGARVVVVDADLRRPRLAELMGLDNAVGLTDVLIGRAELGDVMQPWGARGSLTVLPAGDIPPNPSELLGSRGMQAIVETLQAQFDYVLFDAPPLLPVTDAAVLSRLTSGAVVVAAASRSKRNQLRNALASLDHIDSRVLGMIVTMLPTKGQDAYGYGHYVSYYDSDESPSATHESTRRAHLRKRKA